MSDPNFLLISVDSLRADFCSFLNDSEGTMDFLDDFAAESTVFEQAISPSVWTLPVHTSIFTGLYPREHQVNDEQAILGDHPTFAELLKREGYETRSFTHNGWFQSGGMTRGFTHDHTRMPGMVGYGVSNVKSGLRDGSRPELIKGIKQISEAPLVKGRKAFFRHRFKGARTVTNCFKRLANRSSPFCYMVHLNDVHHVYRPHINYIRHFSDAGLRELHTNVRYQEELKRNRHGIRTGRFEIDQAHIPLMKDLYRASILQADALIERLISRLKELAEYENTVVILFGDHGDLIGEEGMFGHSFSLADELIRVPLLIHDPTGYLDAGRRTDVIQLNDLYPTVLEMAGVAPPETNSISLSTASREAAFVHLLESTDGLEYPQEEYPPFEQYGVWTSPDSKLTYTSDRDETMESRGNEDELKAMLDTHLQQLQHVSTSGESDLDPATRSQLENMGYL
jgi:arylsulfatase A-like enzyme